MVYNGLTGAYGCWVSWGKMHKHTSQLRGSGGSSRGPVRRWNSFHGGGGGGVYGDGVSLLNGNLHLGGGSRIPQEPVRAVPKAVQALRSESVDRGHRFQPPPPPAFPRRRFSVWWVSILSQLTSKRRSLRFALFFRLRKRYLLFTIIHDSFHFFSRKLETASWEYWRWFLSGRFINEGKLFVCNNIFKRIVLIKFQLRGSATFNIIIFSV